MRTFAAMEQNLQIADRDFTQNHTLTDIRIPSQLD